MYEMQLLISTTVLLMVCGFIALILRRDLVRILIGVELLFNAANVLLVGLSTQGGLVDPLPQSIVMMIIVLDGTVVAAGLVLVMNVYKHYKTFDVRKLRRLKW